MATPHTCSIAAGLGLLLVLSSGSACTPEPEPEPEPLDPVDDDEVRVEALPAPVHLSGRPLLFHPEDYDEPVGLEHRTELLFSDDDRYLDDFGGGFAALDCDGDGDVDLAFTSGDGVNQLFVNDGAGRYALRADSGVAFPGDWTSGASTADFDRDGDADLLLLTQFSQNRLLANDGSCSFEDVTAEVGLDDEHRSLFATWADLDEDGWLDLYVANWGAVPLGSGTPPEPEPDRLWLSDGAGGFIDVSEQLPDDLRLNYGMTTGFVDLDGDGDLDLFQINDKGSYAIGNRLYRNDGIGEGEVNLVDVTAETGFELAHDGMGMAFADLDQDGDPDVVATGDIETVFVDSGELYVESGAALGIEDPFLPPLSWGVVAFDPDADGDEDIFYVRSHFFDDGLDDPALYGGDAPLYLNNLPTGGQLQLQPTPGTLGTWQTWRTVVDIDVNGDGYEDLVTSPVLGAPLVFLANPPPDSGVVQVRLRGTRSNTDGRHAVVTLDLDGRLLRRWPGAADSYSTGVPSWVTFGLGDRQVAGPLEVLWPSGAVQQVAEVHAGERLILTEPP
jgi:enediyne biosynthesis protein E4